MNGRCEVRMSILGYSLFTVVLGSIAIVSLGYGISLSSVLSLYHVFSNQLSSIKGLCSS